MPHKVNLDTFSPLFSQKIWEILYKIDILSFSYLGKIYQWNHLRLEFPLQKIFNSFPIGKDTRIIWVFYFFFYQYLGHKFCFN